MKKICRQKTNICKIHSSLLSGLCDEIFFRNTEKKIEGVRVCGIALQKPNSKTKPLKCSSTQESVGGQKKTRTQSINRPPLGRVPYKSLVIVQQGKEGLLSESLPPPRRIPSSTYGTPTLLRPGWEVNVSIGESCTSNRSGLRSQTRNPCVTTSRSTYDYNSSFLSLLKTVDLRESEHFPLFDKVSCSFWVTSLPRALRRFSSVNPVGHPVSHHRGPVPPFHQSLVIPLSPSRVHYPAGLNRELSLNRHKVSRNGEGPKMWNFVKKVN